MKPKEKLTMKGQARVQDFQLYDMFSPSHDGPNLLFHPQAAFLLISTQRLGWQRNSSCTTSSHHAISTHEVNI